jgi:plasmid stability protein
VVALAARAFGPAEARRLQGLDPATREREFRKVWVRHEAALKCRGTGIGGRAVEAEAREIWTSELDVGPRGAGAVAVGGEPLEVRRWDWDTASTPSNRSNEPRLLSSDA